MSEDGAIEVIDTPHPISSFVIEMPTSFSEMSEHAKRYEDIDQKRIRSKYV